MVDTRSTNSRAAQRVNRSLGIRADEGDTVRLFFLHNFLLGIGTVLVYVTANVLLLENHPETSLPVAYVASGIGMVAVGRVYAYFEHHLALQQLATRVLWSVIALTAVLAVVVVFGHSVAAAVAIMVGYRLIYLLTNLEFWAVSALMFDVRQSKRLFGVISSGDMPAKALGAVLAALIHGHGPLVWLLLVAFGCYGAALIITDRTIRLHQIEATTRAVRSAGRTTRPWVAQLFGGSDLISAVCLTMVPVAMLAAGIEYEFFVNVKYKFHDQGEVMAALGKILAVTYLLAMAVKALFSRRVLDRFGILPTLSGLPVLAGAGLLAFGYVAWQPTNNATNLLYFSVLYITFEVVRRAVFDPVLLVLFQPLPPQQRLKGHTLAKGLYEPVGMAGSGAMLLLAHTLGGATYLLLAGVVLSGVLFFFVKRTYRHYVNTLQDALSRRFIAPDEVTLPGTASVFVEGALNSSNPAEVLNALDFADALPADVLRQRTQSLLSHPEASVRQRALALVGQHNTPDLTKLLEQLAHHDADAEVRREAAQQLVMVSGAESMAATNLLVINDLSAREGAITGFLRINKHHPAALASLTGLIQSTDPACQLAALTCLETLGGETAHAFSPFVAVCLDSANPDVVEAALPVVAYLSGTRLRKRLADFLTHRQHGRTAVRSLAALGNDALPLLPTLPGNPVQSLLMKRTAAVAEKVGSEAARTWLLTQLATATPTHRAPLLNALNTYPPTSHDDALYGRLLTDEIALTYRLLMGKTQTSEPMLSNALDYELTVLTNRLLLLLMGLYDRATVKNVRQSLTHQTAERRANSLELLENLMATANASAGHSRAVYACLLSLTDTTLSTTDRLALVQPYVKQLADKQLINAYIVDKNTATFTDWTVLVNTVSAEATQPLSPFLPSSASPVMHHAAPASTSTIERVFLLKSTSLFADTPANVLGSIAPIMKEVPFADGQEIVRKGEIGTSLFVIYDGCVGIYDGAQALAEMGKGDVFGELALLDTEPRSATVIAHGDVLLFRIDQDDFYDLMEERDELLRNIIRLLSRRIRSLNQAAQKSPQAP